MTKPSRADIFKPIPMPCANCGGEGIAYPYPVPRGTFVCACTSLGGMEEFIRHMSAKLAAGTATPPKAKTRTV